MKGRDTSYFGTACLVGSALLISMVLGLYCIYAGVPMPEDLCMPIVCISFTAAFLTIVGVIITIDSYLRPCKH